MSRTVLAIGSMLVLAACGGGGGGDANNTSFNSAFATVNSSGSFTQTIADQQSRRVTAPFGGGYAYGVGTHDGFLARSGLWNGTTGGAPVTGDMVFQGRYQRVIVDDVTTTLDRIDVQPYDGSGTVTLTTDFDGGTFTGSGVGSRDSQFSTRPDYFTFSGTVSDNGFTGTLTANEGTYALTGVLGTEQAVGVFHGSGDSWFGAGGFYATPNMPY